MAWIPIRRGAEAARWIAAQVRPAPDEAARAAVAPIVADVRARGDSALRDWTERWDRVRLGRIDASPEDRRAALESLSPERRRALQEAQANLEAFHRVQLRSEPKVEVRPGVTVWREFRPVPRVGIYVPGGRADYPSSLLMAGVPAKLAGCSSVIACVPPRADGRAPDSVLAVAELLGLDGVYAVGGAQAIAALAYGTETVPRVDKIVGPGNRYVTAAKLMVAELVEIDLPAGPTEIVVLADRTANPRWVAADLVSQAEHGPDTLAVCITDDSRTAELVALEAERQAGALAKSDAACASLAASGVCLAPNLEVAIDWVNALAPEHLAVVTSNDEAVAARVMNAGSIFLGPYAPVAAGDYAAGSNHVLPTGRRSRAAGGLSVDSFGKWVQLQRITAEGLRRLSETVTALARWEGFEAHARAVEVRLQE